MNIKENLENIQEELSFFDDEMDKYEYIIELGKKLEALDEVDKIEDNLVEGCSSQVWLICQKEDDKLVFLADGDAIISKGLVKIILDIFSNNTIKDILEFDIEELSVLNLSAIITKSRQNGVAGMIKKIKEYAIKNS
jgi:cysteine desulfuration protein SufE